MTHVFLLEENIIMGSMSFGNFPDLLLAMLTN